MRRFFVFFIGAVLLLTSFPAFSQKDEDGVIVYPDGDFGMDIGGGYQAMPSKTGKGYDFVPAEPYREPYKDTRYGAQVDDGFSVFPEFSFDRGGEVPKKEEKEEPIEDYIFYEYTTQPFASPLWGVSGPSDENEGGAESEEGVQ